MSSLTRSAVPFLAFILVAGSGLVGTAYFSSGQVESGLKSLAAFTQCNGAFTVRNLVHDRGVFSSWGTADLEIKPSCAPASIKAEPALLSFKIEYHVNHVPTFEGMSRFDWVAKPGGAAQIDLSQLSSSGALMQGQGKVNYGQETASTITVGDLEVLSDEDRLNVKGTQGNIAAGGGRIKLDLQSEKLLAVASDTSLEAEGLHFKADIQDWRTANGATTLEIRTVATALGAMKNITLTSQSDDKGTTISSATQISIGEINAQGQRFEALELDLALDGLDKKSIETLTKAMETLPQDGAPDQKWVTETCEATTGLIQKGLSFKITKIAGKKGNGFLQGDLGLELAPGKADSRYMVSRQLTSHGSLLMSHLLDPLQTKQALASGFFSQSPDGLRVTYSLASGILKVGDQIIDTPDVRAFFRELDQGALEAFNYCQTPGGSKQTLSPQASPEVTAPAPEPMGAEMAAEDIPVEGEESAGNTAPSQEEAQLELQRFRAKDASEKADETINQLWKSAPKDRRQAVLKDQRQWLKARDKSCTEAENAIVGGNGLLKESARFACLAEMTNQRIEVLKTIFANSPETSP